MATNFFRIYEGAHLTPRSTDPSSPKDGDIFYSDGTPRTKGMWQYKDGAWTEFGGAVFSINSISTNTNAAAGETYLVNTGSTVTVTLPASPNANDYIVVKDSTGSANSNNITIDTADAATIDGLSSISMDSNYESKTFVSDGTNWFIL